MAKLVSLRLTKKEAEEEYGLPSEPALPEYPYGTRIELDSDQVEALDLEDAEAETKVEITAHGYIKAVEITDREGEEPRRRVTIQLTDCSVEESSGSRKARKEGERVGKLSAPTA